MRRPRAARPPIRVERDGQVAIVVIDTRRPGNVLDADAWAALGEVADELRLDDDVTVVVLASGGPTFSRGVAPGDQGAVRQAEDAIAALARLETPVVAAVSGAAEGLGLAIVLTADLVVAASSARFRAADPRAGVLPGGGVVQRLTRVVGPAKATTMLLFGTTLGIDEALRAGLAQRRAASGGARQAALRVAKQVARNAPVALRYAKEACRRAFDMTLDQGIRFEQDLYVLLQTTADRREGIAAFRERRMPRFEGR